MSKIKIALHESTSAVSAYTAADGLLNFVKVAALQAKVAAAVKEAAKTDTPLKPTGTYVMKRRAKPVAYSARLEAKKDLKYRAARAIKIALRKRVTPESLARVAFVLQVIDHPKLGAEIKSAATAINNHMKRTEKHVAKISTEKGKLRDAKNAVFEKSVSLLRSKLVEAGFKESDIVESTGMMGKTLLVRLGADNYVSVTSADKVRFSAAVRANKAA